MVGAPTRGLGSGARPVPCQGGIPKPAPLLITQPAQSTKRQPFLPAASHFGGKTLADEGILPILLFTPVFYILQ